MSVKMVLGNAHLHIGTIPLLFSQNLTKANIYLQLEYKKTCTFVKHTHIYIDTIFNKDSAEDKI